MRNVGTIAELGWDRVEELRASGAQVEIRLNPEHEREADLWALSPEGEEAHAMMVAAGLMTAEKVEARRAAARARLGMEG